MLIIKPKYPRLKYCHGGSGIFDIIQKIANSSLAKQAISTATKSSLGKKVINSGIGKTVIKGATNPTLKKYIKQAASSAIGKQAKSALITGLSQASENAANAAFAKLGLIPLPQPTLPPASRKRKRVSKKRKPKKKLKLNSIVNGSGIVFE